MPTVDPSEFVSGLSRNGRVRAVAEHLADDLARTDEPWVVRTALARALGDRSLELAYWIPDLDCYVDVDGRRFDPRPPSGGTETIVLEAGQPVAVLVHDADVAGDSELLNVVCAVAAFRLERERGRQVARLSEKKTQALLDAMPDLMLRIHRDGTYLDVTGDLSLLAAPPQALLGNNVRDVLPEDVSGRVTPLLRRVLETGQVQSLEYRLRTVDDAWHDFEARFVRSGADEVLWLVRDITERKQAELELLRLQDELRASLERLRVSRARIVEAGDTERRRLERNLHDGAQQRLVSVSHHISLARRKLDADPAQAGKLLEQASEQLSEAHEELRELARGIHPVALENRGLQAALHALVSRSVVPTTIGALPDERLPGPVEVAAYYVVAEALTNVAKYAQASTAKIRVAVSNGEAIVEVADDGVGGADPTSGSGLVGLTDRVEAVSGRLEVESPAGEGTRVRAFFPIG
jgi:PAS domain S-box-containing protein